MMTVVAVISFGKENPMFSVSPAALPPFVEFACFRKEPGVSARFRRPMGATAEQNRLVYG